MKETQNVCPAGFSLVEMVVVMAIIGLLAAIAIPNLVSARASGQAKTCINNLSKIDAVVSRFALENDKKAGDPINYPGDLTPGLRLNLGSGIPGCLAGGIYPEGAAGTPPICSLSNLAIAPHLPP